MKNIKIKSYSNKKPNIFNLNNTKKERPVTTNNAVLNDIDKLIKTPELNISSKLDSKGNS